MLWNPFPIISLVFEIRKRLSDLDFNEISQLYGLYPVQRGQDQILVFPGIGAFRKTDAGASPQSVNNKITDRLRVVAYHVKIF